ncbi:MAG: DUF2656 domain-containing protein [Leptolyngbyaceae cyanobacterium SL_7_1]|nr:DUF2656 domain-containing protein [Leptolyngbyaceae cyanobacterium SL_7_1]
MLLSHNFDIPDRSVPQLSRADFATLFIHGFTPHPTLLCRLIDHPHWIVEVLFPPQDYSPSQIGELCAAILATHRRSLSAQLPNILVLGGIKSTPPTSDSPTALQPGQWGVDVVETLSAVQFLAGIGWESAISDKPSNTVFKVEL